MSKKIQAAITELLQSVNVEFNAIYQGTSTPFTDVHTMDTFAVRFYNRISGNCFITDYHMGIGHRKATQDIPEHVKKFPNTVDAARWKGVYVKPVEPNAADVLYSLLSEGDALNCNFNDWCEELGYDKDSIKALETYEACCKIGKGLQKVMSSDIRAQIKELLQDY